MAFFLLILFVWALIWTIAIGAFGPIALFLLIPGTLCAIIVAGA